MAISLGMAGSFGSPSPSSWIARRSGSGGVSRRCRRDARRRGGVAVRCAAGSLADQYQTLRIQPGASEKEVKKAFRQLALQYHPDVCKGRDCGVQFQRINEAYDIVMNSLRGGGEEEEEEWQPQEWGAEGGDQSWDLWEEWMGWEGAGIRDYSSHINPYI